MKKDIAKNLLKFIEASPSTFHVIKNMSDTLDKNGFTRLYENNAWQLKKGKNYYTVRNDSSIIAFKIPEGGVNAFQIMASHSDSPSFKLKDKPEMEVENHYVKFNVEKYGGMLMAPWFDRPLSLAGRVMLRENGKITTRLVNIDRDLILIPNLAIHMNRAVNDGYAYNPQKDMLPLFGGISAKGTYKSLIAKAAGAEEDAVISQEIFCYNRQPGTIWGADDEFISSTKLDDLECAFSSLTGFLAGSDSKNVTLHCVFDNEEVGSGTKQGAAAGFLKAVLTRINAAFGGNEETYLTSLAKSFMVSADNAHAVHPNHADITDPTNRPFLNEGIVIKASANQKYTTDAVSEAIFKSICENAKVPVQSFANRSDILGGSTLGNISNTQVSLNTVDIGLAQLAMHSPYETAGVADVEYLVKAVTEFFSSTLLMDETGNFEITK